MRSRNASSYPEKRVTGDFNKDSQRRVSVATWFDQSGGIGLKESIPGVFNRAWFSFAHLRHPGHITAPAAATLTVDLGAGDDGLISELGGKIIVAFDKSVREYDEGGDSWGLTLVTLGATPTDVANGALGTTEFVVFAIGTGYEYSSSSATWATSTKDALNIAFHDERFWGVDATGQLWFTFTMGSAEENDALLPLDVNDAVTGLFVGRASTGGADILYVSTKKALWFHDPGGRKFVKTSVFLPGNTGNAAERIAVQWRDQIYLGAASGVNEYGPGAPATYRPMGFNIPDGVPFGSQLNPQDQTISAMAASSLELLVGGNPETSNAASIFGWDGRAWQVVWVNTSLVNPIYSMHVSDSGGTYRLWWGFGNRVYHMPLPVSSTPPLQTTGYNFRRISGGTQHEYPIFTADQKEVTKVVLAVKVDVGNIVDVGGGDGVEVLVDIDGAGYVQRTDSHTNDSSFDADDDEIQANGVTTFSFPSVAAPAGTEFKTIQVRVDILVSTGTSGSPDVRSVTIEYLKVLDDKDAFDFEIDCNGEYFGLTPQELRAAFATAKASKTLVELTYRDDTGGTRNPYVKVFEGQADEETGYDEEGTILVHCEEI